MSEFILHKDAGRALVLANAVAFLQGLSDTKAWRIEVKQYRRPRSCAANAYYFGCVLPTIVRELGHTSEDWHEYLCGEFFGWRQIDMGARQISRPIRTTTADEGGRRDVLDTARFWQFADFAIRQAAAAGVYVPGPNEMTGDNR
jgi:hypothetical protein